MNESLTHTHTRKADDTKGTTTVTSFFFSLNPQLLGYSQKKTFQFWLESFLFNEELPKCSLTTAYNTKI